MPDASAAIANPSGRDHGLARRQSCVLITEDAPRRAAVFARHRGANPLGGDYGVTEIVTRAVIMPPNPSTTRYTNVSDPVNPAAGV